MAKVCNNPGIVPGYLDQIDERNQMEKGQFNDLFSDYMQLMDDYGDLMDKMKGLENDIYILR